jgi:hypothetical protein
MPDTVTRALRAEETPDPERRASGEPIGLASAVA